MRSDRYPWLDVLCWAGLIGLLPCCGTPPPPFDPEPLDTLHDGAKIELPDALQVDVRQPADLDFELGDCAVYSLTIHEPGQPTETWFVRTAVAARNDQADGTASFTPPGQDLPVEVDLHGSVICHLLVTDARGQTLSESRTNALPAEVLALGLGPMADVAVATPQLTPEQRMQHVLALPEAARRRALISVFAIQALVELVLGAEPLAPLLDRAVQKPSLWQAALNFRRGVEMNFGVERARAWPHPTLLGTAGHRIFPIEVTAYGERALEASMIVTSGAPPASITGGVVSVAAVHPRDRSISVRLQLQATGSLQPVEWARVVIGLLEEKPDA